MTKATRTALEIMEHDLRRYEGAPHTLHSLTLRSYADLVAQVLTETAVAAKTPS